MTATGCVGILASMSEQTFTTKSGRVLTDADIWKLSDEAERGYDVSHLVGKPSLPLPIVVDAASRQGETNRTGPT